MKKLIKNVAHAFGYRISRLSTLSTEDAFLAMRRLLDGIREPIIFDVGAHHGMVSKSFRDLFPSSTVFAFEPFPESFEKLKAFTASDTKIIPHNFGLSDQEGEQVFHSNVNAQTNSLLPTHALSHCTWNTRAVETKKVIRADFKTLDNLVESLGLPGIDLLKLDVQGAEHLVMGGAAQTCRQKKIGLVYTEILAQPSYTTQKRFDNALGTFYDSGFDLYGLYNMFYTSEKRLCQLDAIFTRAKPGV